jgi:hypothetical protein
MVQSTALCIKPDVSGIGGGHVMGISAGGCEPDDPHDHPSILTPSPPLLRSTPSLPKVASSGGRMSKSRSRNRLRRAPSSAINLFEADLSQRLTRIGSGAALADTTVPESGAAAASITDRLAVNWRPRASFSLEEEEQQEKDDGLAFRIDRSYSWGGQERQIQREEKEKRKLSEVILDTSDQKMHSSIFCRRSA